MAIAIDRETAIDMLQENIDSKIGIRFITVGICFGLGKKFYQANNLPAAVGITAIACVVLSDLADFIKKKIRINQAIEINRTTGDDEALEEIFNEFFPVVQERDNLLAAPVLRRRAQRISGAISLIFKDL